MLNCTTAGMDVHARTTRVCAIRGDELVAERTIDTDPVLIEAFLREHRVARCCYEAGPTGFALQRHLQIAGIGCDIVAPGLIPRAPGDKVKTDRLDARKLARLYQGGLLVPIWVPDPETEAMRDLLRNREDARLDRTAARHRLGKFLIRHGRRMPTTMWGPTRKRWLTSQTFDYLAQQAAFTDYMTTLELLDRRIEQLDSQLHACAAECRFTDQIARLRTIRGIDTLSAFGISAEAGPLDRFAAAPSFMSFTGLVSSEHSSGDSRSQGALTRVGNAHIRRLLVEAAWNNKRRPSVSTKLTNRHAGQDPRIVQHALKCQVRLHRRWTRMQQRSKPYNKIVCAVARELAGFVWAIGSNRPVHTA